ncbi:hypothetical protein [Teichococcus wenyumeiae]|uniref:hypothetical protein n=1 Tax=Teichococcus wenyumeiae TaxID=2478470 RepID=UPI0011C3E985|nr:hypothetical protein [Pseudoroseomonas wenyumeiae]
MKIQRDGKNQPYIEWEQASGAFKRAWVQKKGDLDKDWAGTGRYLNVVRCNAPGRPGGNPTDFPIFDSSLSDEQILRAFVQSVCAMTGCRLPKESDDA